MSKTPDRNLALELVRVTESAAMAASRWVGRGDKNGADRAAVDAMRTVLATVPMTGLVVIGEGEKDEAPMLYNGEVVGDGDGPPTDVAVDPIDGTTLTALGRGNALAVIAVSGDSTLLAVIGLLTLVAGFEFGFVSSLSVMSEAAPEARGTALAVGNAVGTLSRSTALVASGQLYDAFGVSGSLGLTAVALTGAGIALSLQRARRA